MSFGVKNVVKIILDGVFPPRCRGCGESGDYLCERCKNYISGKMKAQKLMVEEGDIEAVYLGFRDEILGELIEEAKYESVRSELGTIAEVVWRGYFEKMGKIILVPMPTNRKHVRQRGLDHMDRVTREVERLSNGQVRRARLLVRAKDTVQVGASEVMRRRQAKEAVKLNSKFLDVDGRVMAEYREARVVAMDDVWTTGASLVEAGKLLKKAGIRRVELVAITKNRARKSPVIRHGEITR